MVIGKHIRIISPSGAILPDYIEGATARLRSWGYTVSEGAHDRGEYGRFSGTDEARIEDLQAALTDPSVDYILCSRGGYGLQRIVNQIRGPFDKCVIGFSDITALHQCYALAGKPSVHGLMCKHIATLPEESEALHLFRNALNGDTLSYDLESHPLSRFGAATGVLIGGNLSVLYGLQGTPYSLNAVLDTQPEGCILFIEDICERHYHIDRMLQNLRMSGVLARIKGLVVGQFTDCEPDPLMPDNSIYATILEAVKGYSYPVLFDFPAGHVDDNRPLRFLQPTVLSVSVNSSHLIIN